MDGADGNMTAYADQEANLTEASGILGFPVREVPAAQFWRERGVLRQKAFDVRLLQALCPLL